MLREYRGFQVNVAPGAYGAVALLSSFTFFISSIFIAPVVGFLALLAMVYIDKPMRFQLKNNRLFSLLFVGFGLACCFLPMLVHLIFDNPEGQFVAQLLIPTLSISMSAMIYKLHTEERLNKEGWRNISKEFE